jgi:RecA/RadA recombinase
MADRRPLLNTAADQRLYVYDESRARAAAAMQKPRNVLVVGEPGSGKTSLLYQALARARARRRAALLLSGRLVADSASLADALLDAAVEEEWVPASVRPEPGDALGPARQIRRLRDAPEQSLVLLDDVTIEQGRTLFGQLRDELWQTPVTFAAAVRPEVGDALAAPPADVFFDQRFTLAPLEGEEAEELLRKRADAGQSALVSVAGGGARQPRALLALAAGEQAHYDPGRQHELLEQAAEVAGRPGAMLLAELWARDGVSASDEHLQRSLGVTRNRLTELLRTLAASGILSSYAEPRAGKAGRPRELYFVRQP